MNAITELPLMNASSEVSVQSMLSVKTADISACIAQINELLDAGCRIIRISTPTLKDVQSMQEIVQVFESREEDIAFIADVHYSLDVAIKAAEVADKVRINPGNFLSKRELLMTDSERKVVLVKKLRPLVEACKNHHTKLRIGVNHGSIYKGNAPLHTADDLLNSMKDYLDVLSELNFRDVVLSIKSSNPWTMIEANRSLKRYLDRNEMDFQIHLGVTEAGSGLEGRVKSALGIGRCLIENIGHTIRVSLTEHPKHEIPVSSAILKASKQLSKAIRSAIIAEKYLLEPAEHLFNKPVLVHEVPMNVLEVRGRIWKGDLFVDSQDRQLLHFDNTNNETYDLNSFVPFSEFSRHHQANYLLVEEHELMECLTHLKTQGKKLPILVKTTFSNNLTDIVKSALIYPSLFKNGTIQGLYLTSANQEEFDFQGGMAAEIFQVSGVRDIKSSIISCPGCSRSNINLESLSETLKNRLEQHKWNVSIMGCAVNGYGEMMKSDLGLIGSSEGKVDIYRNKVLVKSALDESNVGAFLQDYMNLEI